MAGLLRTLETPLGRTFRIIREDGTTEDVEVVADPAAAPVLSVFGRVGNVVAANDDYNSDQIFNSSGVSGANVSDALDANAAAAASAASAASVAAAAAASALAAASVAAQPFKGTRYVDPAFVGTQTGSQAQPMTSINAAFTAMVTAGLTAGVVFIPLGTTITENVVFPTGGGTWEIAAVGNGVGSSTVGARITGSITMNTVGVSFFRLSYLSITGNTTGNAPTGGAILLTETAVRQNGTITLTQSGTGTCTGTFRGFGPAYASKPGGSNTGHVSIAGQITAENWVFEDGCTEAVPTTLTPYPASTWRSCQLGSTNGTAVTMNLNGASNAFFYDCICSGPVTLASTTANYTVFMDGATLAALADPLSGLILTGTGMQLRTLNANRSATTTVAGNVASTPYGARSPAGLYAADVSLTLGAAGTLGALQYNVIYTDSTGTLVTAPVGGTLNIAGAVGSKVSATLVFEHNGAAAPIAFSFTGVTTAGAMSVSHISAVRRLN